MSEPLNQLLDYLRRLRRPEDGNAWMRLQTHESLARYAIEEAYELDQAIADGADPALCSELGDLLLQSTLHAVLAEERGAFTFDDVARAILEKLRQRHGIVHVATSAQDYRQRWEAQKQRERAQDGATSALDGIALALPALDRAKKLQARAALSGFDWRDATGPRAKVLEELAEIDEACARQDRVAIADEIGDLLFACVNLARKLEIDPETALRRANDKFRQRFLAAERLAAQDGHALAALDEAALDHYWRRAKALLSAARAQDSNEESPSATPAGVSTT